MILGIIIGCVVGTFIGIMMMALISCNKVEAPIPEFRVTAEVEDINQLIICLKNFKRSVQSAQDDSCNLACESVTLEQVDAIVSVLQKYLLSLEPTSLIDECALTHKQSEICRAVAEQKSSSSIEADVEVETERLFQNLHYYNTCNSEFKQSAMFNLSDSIANLLILLEILMNQEPILLEWVPNKIIKNTSVLKYTFLDK